MRIRRIDTFTVVLPREVPKGQDALAPVMHVVVARVQTHSGVEGVGYTATLNAEFAHSLEVLVVELGELLIGEEADRPERLLAKMLYPANWIGPGGLLNIAACALDVAVWDLIGHKTHKPLWRLLGGANNQARVYESGKLIATDIDALQCAAAEVVAAGYNAVKMRPGRDRHGRVRDVKARVQAVRDVIGYDVDLMYDVNQTWTPSRAIRVGRALEEFELFWLEDPTLMHDIAGQAAIASALDVPICSGEYHYDAPALLRLLQARAVDYLMVDLMRMGGITQFRKVAALAEVFGVPVTSHLLPELNAHCIAAIPNGLVVEGMPWTQMLFEGLPELVNGNLLLSERPGHGLNLNEAVVRKYRAG